MSLIIADGRMHFYQWDTGQQLAVIHEEGCEEVHFCHNGDEAALVCPIREEEGKRVADVPNILLQRAGTLMAYLSEETETGERIRKTNSFCVKDRPKPEDYIYTETEVINYNSLSNRLEKLEGEGISQAVEAYLKENPVEAGATAEEAAQIQQNKEDIEQLSKGKLDASKLPEAVGDALAQAKASGDFKGEKGDPGEPGKTPEKGKDYFTEADKQEIAELTAPLVDVPEGGSGLTTEQIAGLDNMFKVCAFTKADVSAEYNAFCTAFGIEGGIVPDEPDIPDEPTVTLSSISVTYSGGDVAVGTAVTDLNGIVVTAHYSDGTSEAVTGYTLSGTIAEGENTVTVSYEGKTATFTVTGVAESGGGDGTAVNLYERDGEYLTGNPTNIVWGENSLTFTSGTSEVCVYTHIKLDKLEVGKTYTLFWDAPSATDNASFIRQLHRTTASPGNAATTSFMGTVGVQATNLLAGGTVNASADYRNIHCTFTIPEDIAYLNLAFATKGTGVTGTFQNIAIYEGELTERP